MRDEGGVKMCRAASSRSQLRVRAVPTRFFVLPSHVTPEIEHVVSRHGSYVVVEKLRGEHEVAEETDPRS